MLQNFIKNLRLKPAPVRKGITLGVSLGVTGIASFFWFISFLNYSTQVLSAGSPVESPTSFLGRMGSLIGESYANVRTKIDPVVSGSAFVGGTSTASTTAESSPDFSDTSYENGDEKASQPVQPAAEPGNSPSNANRPGESKSLSDILNTKSGDNQGAKATTSGEVLVQ